MEKYLIVILIFLVFGMGIAIMENRIPIFYMLVGGAIILILYDAKQKRKDRKSKK
jgi:4-hydroxybenzoate polyprenyltransferase